jgi:hypothetical protein
MALSEESKQLMAMLAKSEKDRRRANLAGDLYQASMIAAGQSPLQAQMQSEQLRQQEEGLDEETRFERTQALMKPLGDISEKRMAEYGKLLKDAGDAQSEALKKYLETLKGVASARSGPAAAKIRGEIKLVEAELKQMDDTIKREETATRETNNIAKNIIKAAAGETKEGGAQQDEQFGEVVAQKLDDILIRDQIAQQNNQPRILSPGQRRHLINSLRPAIGDRSTANVSGMSEGNSRESLYQRSTAKDAGQDKEKIKERRQLLIQQAPQRFSRYGVGGSGTIKKAEAALAAASDNYQSAIVKFRTEVPPEALFGSTVYEKVALPQLKAIQEAPSKALPSVHLGRKLMEREDVREMTGGDPTKLPDLLKSFQKSQMKARRLPAFGKREKLQLPADPTAVKGSESVYDAKRQVDLETLEVPDGGSTQSSITAN